MMRVLMVERDQWLAESLANMIDGDVQLARDATAAMTVVDTWKPDVLLLDLDLGAESGVALLHELQSYTDTCDLPVLVMLNDAGRLDLNDLRAYGVRGILDKAKITPQLLHQELANVE